MTFSLTTNRFNQNMITYDRSGKYRIGKALVLKLEVSEIVDMQFVEVRSYIRSLGVVLSDGVLSSVGALFRFVLYADDFPNCAVVWMLGASAIDIANDGSY